MVTRIERPSLTDLAYQALVESIYDRTFPPGEPVSIDGFAERLGISITPVREALVRAASRRLLTRESNKGFRVAPLLTTEAYHQLFDVRRLIELHAVGQAQIDDASVAAMADALARMRAGGSGPAYRDFREYSRADRDFHAALVGMSANAFLLDAWENLHHHLHVSRLYAGSGVLDASEAIAEHAAILEAAREGDRDALVAATREHIVVAERRLATRLPDLRAGA
jgi:DNA-binding GntR family transcriptional regulator